MADPRSLTGKVAVIAGGGKNLGALVARQFAEAGARGIVVHYNSDSSKAESEKTVDELKALGLILDGDRIRKKRADDA